jgi:tRNA(Ile)-lysidine synthase
MLSGGRDSVCLLHMHGTAAMHMNYGLRDEADGDEAFCRELCERLGVPLTVVRPSSAPVGNLQAWARDERYRAAETLTEGDIGVGHTASDQVETVLYRLLVSPGSPRGMAARNGRVVRPLLGWTRAQTTAYCVEHGLAWRDDLSNEDPRYARNRIRSLLASFPAAEQTVLATLERLAEDEAMLDSLVSPEPSVAALRELPPALLRRTLARMAGRPIADPERVLRGADLGGGLRSVVEQGNLRFQVGPLSVPAPAALTVPGQIAWGEGVVRADVDGKGTFPGALDPASLTSPLEVRTWQHGDRMRPAGLGGTKSLQDIFTDRKVPRETRHQVPVVVSQGEIAWIPGVTGERFKAGAGPAVRLTWELGSG